MSTKNSTECTTFQHVSYDAFLDVETLEKLLSAQCQEDDKYALEFERGENPPRCLLIIYPNDIEGSIEIFISRMREILQNSVVIEIRDKKEQYIYRIDELNKKKS